MTTTISPELFLAILSMDAYNRGYDAGIGDGQNVVDGVDSDGLGRVGSQIGNATDVQDAQDIEGIAEVAGFYAVAYQWNGETVISYCGTDNANLRASGSDFWNGWTLGAGDCGPRRRHSGGPTKTSEATSLPLVSIPLSLQTMRHVDGSRNGSSEATTSLRLSCSGAEDDRGHCA